MGSRAVEDATVIVEGDRIYLVEPARARQRCRRRNRRTDAREGRLPRPHHVRLRRNELQGTRARCANFIQCKTAGVLDDSREALCLTLAIHVPIAAGTGCLAPGHPHSTLP
jgi:hypothetical protein